MAFVPTTGTISITQIRNARNSDGTAGTTSSTYSVLRDGANFSKFDSTYLNGATTLSQVTNFSQWRNYPKNTPTITLSGVVWFGIANNQTTTSPVQLICGWDTFNQDGKIHRSTNYGSTYSVVLSISDRLYEIRYLPDFRHASYLSIVPFVAVGEAGRIVTNILNDGTDWITVGSPTSQDLFSIAANSSQAIIVGDSRILKSNTANRISSWTVVNSTAAAWRSVASNGSIFVAVGNGSKIITGDSAGTTWTLRDMPPLVPSKDMLGVTYHTDGYFYAVGRDTSSFTPYMMRSNNGGVTWETYQPSGDSFVGALFSVTSINNKLYIGGSDKQYEIDNGVCREFNAPTTVDSVARWVDCVKDAQGNGFDMVAGRTYSTNNEFSSGNGAYSNF